MKISGEYLVSTSVDETWSAISDLERLVPSIPGVELVSGVGDDVLCKVRVGIGAFSGEFAGKARFQDLDEARHRAVIEARTIQAEDTGIVTVVVLQLHPVDGHTRITADTDLDIAGELAEVDPDAVRHAWDRLLRRSFERVDLKVVGGQGEPSVGDLFLKYAAAGVASAVKAILGLAAWRPRPVNPPQDPR